MKIQCPSCKKMSTVPDAYEGKRVNCKSCKESFTAEPCKNPPIVVPDSSDTRIYSAVSGFGFQFLGVIGVIIAILIGPVLSIAQEFGSDSGFAFLLLFVGVWILLSLILFALGSILKAITMNQCDKSSK